MLQATNIGTLTKEQRRLLTYSRLGSLSYMYYYSEDGIEYKELKEALNLKDSQLAPQLLWLRKNNYARMAEEEVDNQKISVYYIEKKGKEAYADVLKWLKNLPTIKEQKEGN